MVDWEQDGLPSPGVHGDDWLDECASEGVSELGAVWASPNELKTSSAQGIDAAFSEAELAHSEMQRRRAVELSDGSRVSVVGAREVWRQGKEVERHQGYAAIAVCKNPHKYAGTATEADKPLTETELLALSSLVLREVEVLRRENDLAAWDGTEPWRLYRSEAKERLTRELKRRGIL